MKLIARTFVRFWHATVFIAAGIASGAIPLILIGIAIGVLMNVWIVREMK